MTDARSFAQRVPISKSMLVLAIGAQRAKWQGEEVCGLIECGGYSHVTLTSLRIAGTALDLDAAALRIDRAIHRSGLDGCLIKSAELVVVGEYHFVLATVRMPA